MIRLFGSTNLRKMLDEAVELIETKKYSKAEESFRNIIKLSRKKQNLQIEATALEHLGNSLFMQRRFGESFVAYSKGLAIYEKEFPQNHLGKARCLHGLGDVFQFIGDDADANKYYRQAEISYRAAGDGKKAKYCKERYSTQITRLEGG